MDWQPIEAAPKDDAEKLVWDGSRIRIAFWDGGWRVESIGEGDSPEIYPTHWMSLPTPPKEQ